MSTLLAWIESTALASTIAQSLALTASLSAIHLLGFTLVMGSALLGNFERLGVVLPQGSVADVVRPANRALIIGLAMSVTTGALLFSARASEVGANGTFQLKMLLLVMAVTCQVAVAPRARAGAILSLAFWLALAVTACAFILLE